MLVLSINRLHAIAGEGVTMQPSPAMQALIEQIITPFVVIGCRRNLWFVVNIAESAGTKGITEYIVTSDPVFLINAWNSSPGPDPQNSDEVRIFCRVYWNLLHRGILTIFTCFFSAPYQPCQQRKLACG